MTNNELRLSADALVNTVTDVAARYGLKIEDMTSAIMLAAFEMSVGIRGPVDAIENLRDIADVAERGLMTAHGNA